MVVGVVEADEGVAEVVVVAVAVTRRRVGSEVNQGNVVCLLVVLSDVGKNVGARLDKRDVGVGVFHLRLGKEEERRGPVQIPNKLQTMKPRIPEFGRDGPFCLA